MATPAAQKPIAFDVDALRRQFPALAREVYGKPLVYLDSAASAHKPESVIEAEVGCYREYYSNVHRGVHYLSQRATEAYEAARENVSRYIGAGCPREVVFVRGTTEGINLVASTFGRELVGAGDEVLITAMEHHSNIVPWQMLCREKGAKLVVAPINERGEIVLGEYERLLGERTRLAAFGHVSNALGTVNPVAEMVATARERGIPTVIDGAQALPHLRVDVAELGCDFYALSGHKMFGPSGIGALYGKLEHLTTMPPYQGGGEMIRTVTFEKTEYAEPPAKFEAGTPNIAGAVGLGAAVDFMRALDPRALAAYEDDLLDYATRRLEEIPGVRLIGTAAHKAAVASFIVDGVHAHDVGTILDREGIAVRAGHHCAQPVMDFYGVAATARASLALYNTRADVDALVAGIGKIREVFRIMSELTDLYQEVILDHNKKPRNFGPLEDADRTADGHNPLCGDQLRVYLTLDGDTVSDIHFEGTGCAISKASASLMTEAVKGKTIADVEEMFGSFHELLTGDPSIREKAGPKLGKLAVFEGVREFPVRVKCATLAWHTLDAALSSESKVASTE